MKSKIAALAAFASLLVGVVTMGLASTGSSASAEGTALPGMCNGRTDANVVLNAHANGQLRAPKYILNISTDASGHPTGTLVVGQGKDRLLVEEWCRLWLHIPGTTPGGSDQCEGEEGDDPNAEGAINAHAVGIGWYKGQQVLVRTDVRQTDEGKSFRIRFRAMGQHHEDSGIAAADEGGGCEDESWIRVPAEGWAPLAQLNVR